MNYTIHKVQLPFKQTVMSQEIDSFELARFKFSNRYVDIFCFPGFSKYELEQTCDEFIDALSECKKESEFPENPLHIRHRNPHVEHALFQYHYKLPTENDLRITKISQLTNNLTQFMDRKICSHIKLKINDNYTQFNKLAEQLVVCLQINHSLSFRLDANQQLNKSTLADYYTILIQNKLEKNLDYFEEPLSNYDDYRSIDPGIPIAIEENIESYLRGNDDFRPKAIVYKPSQQGVSRLRDLCNQRVVISSCFDPTWSFKATNAIALLYPDEWHGLGVESKERDLVYEREVKN